MFEYLNPADRPVIDGLEQHEIVMAKDQPEYRPLRCLPGRKHGERLSRWTFTPEQRQAIADGADVFLELMTFDRPMNPIRIAVSDKPNPDYFREVYRLKPATAALRCSWPVTAERPSGAVGDIRCPEARCELDAGHSEDHSGSFYPEQLEHVEPVN